MKVRTIQTVVSRSKIKCNLSYDFSAGAAGGGMAGGDVLSVVPRHHEPLSLPQNTRPVHCKHFQLQKW